ncbi:MAG: c-type cytochrome [Catalinimonas sp.]
MKRLLLYPALLVGGLSTLGGCDSDVRKAQYFTQGMYLYEQRCLSCHGADGAGLGRLYPPLAGADYLAENPRAVICGVKWGMRGEMVVNGVTYNQNMPGQKDLRALEIAQIVTYIRNAWGNEADRTTVEEVEAALRACQDTPPTHVPVL